MSTQVNEAAGPLGAFRGASSAAQWRVAGRRFRRRRTAMAALAVLGVLALSAVFAPLLTPYEVDPFLSGEVLDQARQPPSLRHPFGTDELGRDQLTRVLHGGRISLLIGLCVAVASSVIGTTVGAVAGYFGGRVDQLLMRLVDLLLVLPGTALLMIAQRGLGSSLQVIILVLAGLFWRVMSRMVRSVFVSLKEQEFVEAARAIGTPDGRLIVRHLLPNVVAPIIVATTLSIVYNMIAEVTLSFLGFGVPPGTPTWGNILNAARTHFTTHPLLAVAPGLTLTVAVLAINFVGDGLRDAFGLRGGR